MKLFHAIIAMTLLALVGPALADGNDHGYKYRDSNPRYDLYEYAEVIDVKPNYRQQRVSSPIRECWDEPVYQVKKRQRKSAGGILAGGIIGGIIGNQIGSGHNKRISTAVGSLLGAKIGHDAVNGRAEYDNGYGARELVGYEEHCKTRYQRSYHEVVDGYDVTYRFRGQQYHVQMPYDPGSQLKMRIQFSPVI